jgi:hypothetical protein
VYEDLSFRCALGRRPLERYLKFPCFTSTKVQILTPKALLAPENSGAARECAAVPDVWRRGADGHVGQVLSLLALLVQKYEY